MAYTDKEKQAYLRYFEDEKNAGKRPLSFGQWLEVHRPKGRSVQTRKQLETLSPGDYSEISKFFKVK